MSDWNQSIIDEFRANDGVVTTGGFGSGLVILHTTGAKSATERVTPVVGFPHGTGWLVIASKAGAPTHPAWYFNLRAHPEVSVEAPGREGEIAVTATELEGDEYAAAWSAAASRSPGFADYAAKAAPRIIPVFLLTPR